MILLDYFPLLFQLSFVFCLAGSISEGSSNGSIGLFCTVLSSDFVFSPVGSICESCGSPAPDCCCISKSVAESSTDTKAKSILVILDPMLLPIFVMFLTGLLMLFVTVVFLLLFQFGFFEDTFIKSVIFFAEPGDADCFRLNRFLSSFVVAYVFAFLLYEQPVLTGQPLFIFFS